MLELDRIDISEGKDIDKTDRSRKCSVCHYWYFLKINFRFQTKVCNGCHDMTEMSMSLNDVAFVTVGRNDYRIHF